MSEMHHLTLEPLAPDAWRLCDRSVAAGDADSLIAYIELRIDGHYEVTWVHPHLVSATYIAIGDLLSDAAQILRAPRFADAPPDSVTRVTRRSGRARAASVS